MRLEKIELKGFKSFAGQTVLTFPDKGKEGLGITAVVGPNGSGKSNIADAIRWCLGEQSMKNLRAKTGGDVIFSGSSTKGKLSMAEVSLFLNNEDKKAPIDYSELVITRRAFRNGESEYFINNTKTRLGEIQMLLAKSNFGQKSYSVIGQGMVDNFLGSNPAERKDFFDEATGVKQFQIRREEALRKLIKSHENIAQANMLIAEIEPHLKSLSRQVNKLKRKHEIEQELEGLRTKYFRHVWHNLNQQFQASNHELLRLEQEQRQKSQELEKINEDLAIIERDGQQNDDYIKYNQQLSELHVAREELIKKTSSIQTQLSLELESSGNFDLSWLFNRENELKREIEENKQSSSQINNDLASKKLRSQGFEDEKNHLNNQISNFNQKLLALSSQNTADNSEDKQEKIQENLQELKTLLSEINQEDDIVKIKSLLQKISQSVDKIEDLSSGKKKADSSVYVKQREIQDRLVKLTQEREQLIERNNAHSLEINSLTSRLAIGQESLSKKENELADILSKIKKNQTGSKTDNKDLEQKKDLYEKELLKIDAEINASKENLNKLKSEEEIKRAKLFKLQRAGQSLQAELNENSHQISSVQVNSTKYETRLEGLEADIREVAGNLKDIQDRAPKPEEKIDIIETERKIKQLVNQFNLIGGIDPEIEKEHEETKNKYDFLFKQSSDIEQTIDGLEDVIKELDKKIKEKFSTEFKTICNKFEEYFKILFGGGSAKIIKLSNKDLEQEDKAEQEASLDSEGKAISPEEPSKEDKLAAKVKKMTKNSATGLAGIDIQANPPGKVIKSLNVLSGGEKAMTAIALICAIINVNPSPFVVLDEIDAALDESNAERLSKILVDLSHKTQFIAITHNRAPMHKADVLYGVTMKDNGISQLLSIKLKDYLGEE